MTPTTATETTIGSWHWGPPPVELPPSLVSGASFPRFLEPGDAEPGDHLEDFVDDLERWLEEHPEDRDRFAGAGAWMAYRVAVKLATSGLTEVALHYFEFGEELRPDFPDLHINHAIALHALGREKEAIEHYEAALPILDPMREPHVFHLAAQLHFRHGRQDRARELMETAVPALPEDEAFWDLWAQLSPGPSRVEETGPVEKPEAPFTDQPQSPARSCPSCGAEVAATARFCGRCGASLKAKPEAHCPSCGAPVSPDAKFCGNCGAKIFRS